MWSAQPVEPAELFNRARAGVCFAAGSSPCFGSTESGGSLEVISQMQAIKLRCLRWCGQPCLDGVIQVPKPTCLFLIEDLLPSPSSQSVRIWISNTC